MLDMFITKELVEATVQERLREATVLQRQHEAFAQLRPRGAAHRAVPPKRRARLPDAGRLALSICGLTVRRRIGRGEGAAGSEEGDQAHALHVLAP